jgi:Serine aminopeptidase, S33
MPTQTRLLALRTLDGLRLASTLVVPAGAAAAERAVVLVHGGGVTREEGGFFTRLAAALGEAGVSSLRFDLRGHGESEGRQEELTLAAILNGIKVALAQVREEARCSPSQLARRKLRGRGLRPLRCQVRRRARPPGPAQPAVRLQVAHHRQPTVLDGRLSER